MISPSPVSELLEKVAPRAGPLITTVFGDSIAPRSDNIWLGSLIALMAELGLSERLVRTGVYRLAQDGWLESRTSGRRSYYSLTPSGRGIFAEADARIYASSAPEWNGTWTIVQALPNQTASQRKHLRHMLKWQGFGQFSPTLMAKPQRRRPQVSIKDVSAIAPPGTVSIFSARLEDIPGTASLPETAAAAWQLTEINQAYDHFVKQFSQLAGNPPFEPSSCFTLRSLLIHEYRRILLKDPQLPAELLPGSWSGAAARDLAANLYRKITPQAQDFVLQNLQSLEGTVHKPARTMHERFA